VTSIYADLLAPHCLSRHQLPATVSINTTFCRRCICDLWRSMYVPSSMVHVASWHRWLTVLMHGDVGPLSPVCVTPCHLTRNLLQLEDGRGCVVYRTSLSAALLQLDNNPKPYHCHQHVLHAATANIPHVPHCYHVACRVAGTANMA
jgi:hypothetical protein